MMRAGGSFKASLRANEQSAAPAVGTTLLVVITVALIIVVGLFAFKMFSFESEPPALDVTYSKINNRWSIQVSGVSEEVPIDKLRLVAHNAEGAVVSYDTDADTTLDTLLASALPDLLVPSADGAQASPIVFVDHDSDGRVTPGDILVAFGPFYPPVTPLMDATRGYKRVSIVPNDIPRGSRLLLLASPTTISGGDINPGDNVSVTIQQGAFTVTRQGVASGSSSFETWIDLEESWSTGGWTATFTVRPGEGDEWSDTHPFHVTGESNVSTEDRAFYDSVANPLYEGCIVSLIHVPTNTAILEFRL